MFGRMFLRNVHLLFIRRTLSLSLSLSVLHVLAKSFWSKKHWCTHESYGPKKFPKEHHCFQKQNVSLANAKLTVEFRGDPLFKTVRKYINKKKWLNSEVSRKMI